MDRLNIGIVAISNDDNYEKMQTIINSVNRFNKNVQINLSRVPLKYRTSVDNIVMLNAFAGPIILRTTLTFFRPNSLEHKN